MTRPWNLGLFKLPRCLGLGISYCNREVYRENNLWDKLKHSCSSWWREGGWVPSGAECSFFPNVPLSYFHKRSAQGHNLGEKWMEDDWSGLISFCRWKNKPTEHQGRCDRASHPSKAVFLADTQMENFFWRTFKGKFILRYYIHMYTHAYPLQILKFIPKLT